MCRGKFRGHRGRVKTWKLSVVRYRYFLELPITSEEETLSAILQDLYATTAKLGVRYWGNLRETFVLRDNKLIMARKGNAC